MKNLRSSCPINFGLEIFGDQWSLLIVRDIAFNSKVTYGEFLTSTEGISTNILATRLKNLVAAGIVKKNQSSGEDKRVIYYSLTQKGRNLAPLLVECILWGAKYGTQNEQLLAWAAEIKTNKQMVIDRIINADNNNV